MIHWTCNLCGHDSQNGIEYFHREMGLCSNCGSNVRFRAIWYLLKKYVFQINIDKPEKIVGIGLSDADLYANKLSKMLSYKNTYFHQKPFLDITDSWSAAKYTDLDFVICSDVLEHVDAPVANAFKNLSRMVKESGYLIFSVPYVTDAISQQTIEHFVQHKESRVAFEDGREYLITDKDIAYANLCWHGGPGSVLERRVFAEAAVRQHLAENGFVIQEVGDGIAEQGIIHNTLGSKVMICRKYLLPA
jgi:SAM-dependent methyltransferase